MLKRWPNPSGDSHTAEPVRIERTEISYARLVRGWPRRIARIRTVLPAHLQQSPPPAIARRGSWFVVALIGRRAIGFAWIVPGVGSDDAVYIEEVAVTAEWQRRGIGSRLVSEAVSWMDEGGATEVMITPISGSDWVTRLGFRRWSGSMYVASPSDVRRTQ
jgi:GNAT superfamily N-acetyltransferase